MKNSTDLRVIKTKNALTQAMVQCLKEKTFDEITVQDICNKAMTRRSTFYTHFADKYELFAFTVREIYCQFPSFKQLEKVETIKEVYDFLLKDVVNFLVDNIKIVKLMQENKTNMMLLDIIAKEVMKAFLPILEKEESLSKMVSPELVMNFYVKGIFGVVLWWIKEKQPITKEELIVQISFLVKTNLMIFRLKKRD